MKLLLALSAIFLVASAADTLYLKLKLRKVKPQIADSLVKGVADLVPGLVETNIPDQYSNLAPDFKKYLRNISFKQDYDSGLNTSDLNVYFPDIPAELNDQMLPVLQSYTNNSQVTTILQGLLPEYLKCGQCEFSGLFAGLSPSSSVPAPAPVGPGSIVGLQLVMNGAVELISQSLIDLARSQFPTVIDDELQKVVDLGSYQKQVLKDFISKVDLAQQLDADAAKLTLRLTFPKVPSSYVELYEPLFDMHVVQNKELFKKVEEFLPPSINCSTGCSLDAWELINENIITNQPTKAPTKQPTKLPTVSPSITPSSSPITRGPTAEGKTFSPSITPTVSPSLLPSISPSRAPTFFPTSPTAGESSSASSLSVGFGLLMTIVAVAV